MSLAMVVLLLGVAVVPSINANVDSKLIEIKTNYIGISRIRPHTVKLTQKQNIELDQLFNNIKKDLEKAENRAELEESFKNAFIQLEKFGLITHEKQSVQINNRILIIGFAHWIDFFIHPDIISSGIFPRFFNFLHTPSLLVYLLPLKFNSTISFGTRSGSLGGGALTHESNGWLFSTDLHEKKYWNGSFVGGLDTIEFRGSFSWIIYYIGAKGFKGINIARPERNTFLIGTVDNVNLDQF